MSNPFEGLGALGGLVKGLSGLMPQDDPAVQLMNAQTEVSDLQKKEQDLYAQIGRKAIETGGLEQFGELADQLRLVQTNLSAAKQKLDASKSEQQAKEQAEKAERESRTCPSCGHLNPEGTKFCQECGNKVGPAGKVFCTTCGVELAPGTRFCGECGARQAD